jgi:signal transduction histidine kinase/CheY-like chemotaxis protein
MSNRAETNILVLISDSRLQSQLTPVLQGADFQAVFINESDQFNTCLQQDVPDVMVITSNFDGNRGFDFVEDLHNRLPITPIIFLFNHESPANYKLAFQLGAADCICLPVRSQILLASIHKQLERSQRRKDWVLLQARRSTSQLQDRIGEMETLVRLGRSITSHLDLDQVFTAIVKAAVELTGTEEGSLMLVDEESNELFVRAARNFNDEFVRTFRLPIIDSLAGTVLETGRPVLLDESAPRKIATTYLVHNLIYVPLKLQERVIGILSVDNRTRKRLLQNRDVQLLSALAAYAVIAIENARLFTRLAHEQSRLDTLLSSIRDVVILVDQDLNLALINSAARQVFNLDEQDLLGYPFAQVFRANPELIDLVEEAKSSMHTSWTEVEVTADLILSAQLIPVPDVGYVISMHNITHLKKLDQLKSDMVSTVSHDLRSPLTSILGYIELVRRSGPVNAEQAEYLKQVSASVQEITHLVNDLLNLDRLEEGLETGKEQISAHQFLQLTAGNFSGRIQERGHLLVLELPKEDLNLYGSMVQLRQMLENLMDNAVKYTPPGGEIYLTCRQEDDQVLIQVRDSGIGIPFEEQPRVFERFFRASNVNDQETNGSGLGLAIVRSIVENHHGRIWIDSAPGQGSTFSILLPLVQSIPLEEASMPAH